MEHFIVDLGVLLVVSAFFSYLAVIFKQPIIMGYIVSGVLIGPWGFGLIEDVNFIENISHLGITLLLFLAGLCLHPQKLIGLFRKTFVVVVINCIASFGLAFLFSNIFQFSLIDSICIGLAMMFSSTILCVKLLPTTKLHQKRMGAICIGVLILEDLLAIAVLAFVRCLGAPDGALVTFSLLLFKLIILIGFLFLLENFVLVKIMARVERLHEMLFILGLAWCFGIASISNHMGLFYETGAFFAGVVLARHPISFFISERLKPLRDFFLVLFFFTLGAKLDIFLMQDILLPSIVLSVLFVVLKPLVFKIVFIWTGEEKEFSSETGFRLGQLSEFSLLIALLAFNIGYISSRASQFIQLTAIFTFIISSYIVVYRYPTPIGTSDELIRD